MKANDIVNQLAARLPMFTGKFTTDFSISSLTRAANTVTAITTVAHGLIVGSQASIQGAQTTLTVDTLTRAGVVGTLVSDNPHDFTEKFSKTVEISGAGEAEFNGTFTLLTVPNRKTVTFTMADSGATTATGSILLLNGASELQQYNGLKNITAVPTTTSFEFTVADATLGTPAAGTIIARTQPRLSAAVSSAVLVDAYTAQLTDDLWAFVVLGDVFASKSRRVDSDATDNIQRGDAYRQQLVYPFSVIVFFPTADEILARQSRDEAEDIFLFLCQSLLSAKLNSGLFVGAQHPIVFVDHGFFVYNKAFYAHIYNFQTVADLTFDDTVQYDADVAFRDVDVDMTLDVGTAEDPLTATIDLDDLPLP